MKYRYLFYLLALIAFPTNLSAQTNHCVQDRYAQTAVFDSVDIEQIEYMYSIEEKWPSTVLDTLDIKIFKPIDALDPVEKRPFILMVHGGAFLAGNKDDMGYLSMEMARRGFVTGTIDYRLGWDCNPSSALAVCIECGAQAAKMYKATYRAVQDARAALRYVVENANLLGVDTSQIFVQGTSAGAITVLHTAFWDQAEANAYCSDCEIVLGGLNSTGLAPQHDFTIKGVINNCGAISGVGVMDNASIPVVGFHDEWDCTVPYQGGQVLGCFGCTAFYFASGSSLIRNKLNTDGICYGLNTVPATLNHCSYPNNAIIGKAACFIKSILCNQCSSYVTTDIWDIPDCLSGTVSASLAEIQTNTVDVFPNPVNELLTIRSEGQPISRIKIISMEGRKVAFFSSISNEIEVDVSTLKTGVYFIHIALENGSSEIQRIVVN